MKINKRYSNSQVMNYLKNRKEKLVNPLKNMYIQMNPCEC